MVRTLFLLLMLVTYGVTQSSLRGGASISGGAKISSETPLVLFPSGWSSGTTGQTLANVDSYPGGSDCPYASFIDGVIYAWSSAAVDDGNHRMLFFGEGHVDGCDNSIYSWTLNANGTTSWSRAFGPTLTTGYPTGNGDAVPGGGAPEARHTYNGIGYAGGKLYLVDGVPLFLNTGGFISSRWVWNGSSWTSLPSSNGQTNCGNGGHCNDSGLSYDSSRSLLWYWDGEWFYSIDPATNTITEVAHPGAYQAGVHEGFGCDPTNHICLFIGSDVAGVGPDVPGAKYLDISVGSTFILTNAGLSAAGGNSCAPIMNAGFPAVTYNSKIGKLVMFPGSGSTIYILNWSTRDCTAQTFAGGGCPATLPNDNGIFGHFAYIPSLDVYGCYTNASATGKILNPN
jgi:hypothetical protein